MSFDYGNFQKVSQEFDELFKKSSQELEKKHQENVKNFFESSPPFGQMSRDFETFNNNLRSPPNFSNSFSKFSEEFNPIKGTVWEPKPSTEKVGSKDEMVTEVVTKEWNILEEQGHLSKLSSEDKEKLKNKMHSLANAIYETCRENFAIVDKQLFETQINSFKIGKTSLHSLWLSSLSKEELEKVQDNAHKYTDI